MRAPSALPTHPHTPCPRSCLPPPQVWVIGPDTATTIVVSSAIQASEGLSPAQAEQLVAALLKAKR